jgi:beta-phosphoglucomutase-like phosphatase (HAD superfamily)
MIALIFDMDGVIVDSNAMHRESWEVFNRRYGLETTEEMHQRMYGKRNDQIVRDFFGDAITALEVDARGRAKEHLYREMMSGRTKVAGAGLGRVPGGPSGSTHGGGEQRRTRECGIRVG